MFKGHVRRTAAFRVGTKSQRKFASIEFTSIKVRAYILPESDYEKDTETDSEPAPTENDRQTAR